VRRLFILTLMKIVRAPSFSESREFITALESEGSVMHRWFRSGSYTLYF